MQWILPRLFDWLAIAVVAVAAAAAVAWGLWAGWVLWWRPLCRAGQAVLRRFRRAPQPITLRQFLDLFRTVDEKLYSGLLQSQGVHAWLTEIRPDYPYVFDLKETPDGKLIGETCAEPHDYFPDHRLIVVASNQSNREIMEGLVIEMTRAVEYYREFYRFMLPILKRDAEIIDEALNLFKQPDTGHRMEELAKLIERWPKLE